MAFLAGNPYSNRVTRTFGFIDLSGFTAYTQGEGDEVAVEALQFFRAATREVCARHGVRIAKWLGDGAMLVAVEAEDLAESITELRRLFMDHGQPLPLKAGVATGPVILFEGDDYIGSIVNLAARLADLAQPGQLLAPKEFISAMMVNTEAITIGPITIQGFPEPVEVVALENS
ncbi:MAG: adenylate/guanylate cyclase domain-containing protein [Actinomycetota bacterium]